eukprot:665378-Pyramimonas_sp.AAC.1
MRVSSQIVISDDKNQQQSARHSGRDTRTESSTRPVVSHAALTRPRTHTHNAAARVFCCSGPILGLTATATVLRLVCAPRGHAVGVADADGAFGHRVEDAVLEPVGDGAEGSLDDGGVRAHRRPGLACAAHRRGAEDAEGGSQHRLQSATRAVRYVQSVQKVGLSTDYR